MSSLLSIPSNVRMAENASDTPLSGTRSIVVLGAGVIGLSIAFKLSSNPSNK